MKVEKFHTDIKKEPGRIFMKELEKNKEGMTDKFTDMFYPLIGARAHAYMHVNGRL
jgi:hypothetical protein